MARAAFSKPDVFAQMTGMPESLVQGIKTAIEAIDCKSKISPEKFARFSNAWLDDFHSSPISWNWLSPTMHLLFVHGSDILRASPVAPGFLSGQFVILIDFDCIKNGFHFHFLL